MEARRLVKSPAEFHAGPKRYAQLMDVDRRRGLADQERLRNVKRIEATTWHFFLP